MSTFSTYDTLIQEKLANTSEIFYTEEAKRNAANDTVKEVLREYDIPEFIKKPTSGYLTFASGSIAKPTDYFRMVKLWKIDTSGVQSNEYQYIEPDDFDKLASGASYYWTEDFDTATSTRKLYIKPTTETTVYCRYIKSPTEMTDDLTDCGLSSSWDEVIALGSAKRLLQQATRWDEAREMERLYNEEKKKVYLSVKHPGGIKGTPYLKSVYRRKSLLGRTGGEYNYTK